MYHRTARPNTIKLTIEIEYIECQQQCLLPGVFSRGNRSSTICNLEGASFSGPSSYWDQEFHLRIICCASSPRGPTVEKES
jgi:hypothetical protein